MAHGGCDPIFSVYFSFLAKRGVKEEIMSFNARKITPEIRDSVQELLDKNKKSFDPAVSLYDVCIQPVYTCVHIVYICTYVCNNGHICIHTHAYTSIRYYMCIAMHVHTVVQISSYVCTMKSYITYTGS